MNQEPTINDVLEAVQTLSTHIDNKFADVDNKFVGMDEKFSGIHTEIDKMRSEMVTKDYLDEKLADLRGDLVVLTRKEDHKVRELISILQKKNVLDAEEAQHLLKMEPFPILVL